MSQPKIFAEALGMPLKSAGFKKKRGDTWYLNNSVTTGVLNLQKPSYGPQCDINIGIWLKALCDADMRPKHLATFGAAGNR